MLPDIGLLNVGQMSGLPDIVGQGGGEETLSLAGRGGSPSLG